MASSVRRGSDVAEKSSKFERVFAELADLREEVVTIKAHEEDEQRRLAEMAKKLDGVICTLHEVIGKESVRASIYGVIGSIVSGVVVWLITLVKGS